MVVALVACARLALLGALGATPACGETSGATPNSIAGHGPPHAHPQTLAGYEDSLLALALLLSEPSTIGRRECGAAVRQPLARHPGFLGVE